jgi:NAD(P)-dependent dehydrogenase (short-subunit alcohol dehydrogenase family)
MADQLIRQMATAQNKSCDQVWEEAVYPARRAVDPQEVANTIAFLASDAASGINGQAVSITLGGAW